jgi:hypothetical protein
VALATDTFLCIDPITFDFEDSNGGSGNVGSNTYTMSNGVVTEVANGATTLPTPSGSRSEATATATSGDVKATAGGAIATATASPSGAALVSGAGNTSAAASPMVEKLLGVALLAMGVAGVLL